MRCTNVFRKLLIFPPGIKIRKSTSNFFRFLTCPSKFIIFHETKIKMVGFLKILHIIFASDEYNFFIFICLWKTGTTEPGIENCKAIECINSTNSICSNWCANVILAELQLCLVKGKKTLLSVWQGMAIMGHILNKKMYVWRDLPLEKLWQGNRRRPGLEREPSFVCFLHICVNIIIVFLTLIRTPSIVLRIIHFNQTMPTIDYSGFRI